MRIMTDSGALYSTAQGKEIGLDVACLQVVVNDKSYIEFEEISSEEFLAEVKKGGVPTSSQPPIGTTMGIFEEYPDEEFICISMADGLSGTYASTVSASESVDNSERITVLNSRTLCGPQRYLVQTALKLRDQGLSKDEVVAKLNELIETSQSYLIPQDFGFLKRGGRLTPLAANALGFLKVVPIMTQTPDGRRLDPFGIKKTFKGAVKEIIKHYKETHVEASWHFSVSHAGEPEQAKMAESMIKEAFPGADVHIYLLSPAYITQGGPSCVALQVMKKL